VLFRSDDEDDSGIDESAPDLVSQHLDARRECGRATHRLGEPSRALTAVEQHPDVRGDTEHDEPYGQPLTSLDARLEICVRRPDGPFGCHLAERAQCIREWQSGVE
jgi:hypothetical protein